MSSTRVYTEAPPFWRRFGLFFAYIRQEKLFFQVTLLALLNFLLVIPFFIIQILVEVTLFLASYKLAFEVLNAISRGEFQYRDSFSHQISEMIGFKALGMPILQLLIFIFVFRYDPTTGAALLLLTTILTPAFLMILAESQSLSKAMNPLTQIQIASRMGAEYAALTIFIVVLSAVNLLTRFLLVGILPPLIEVILLAWLLYVLLVFSFSVIGYVMYRHADSIGHETTNHEKNPQPTSSTNHDPIKQRIEELITAGDGRQALAVIEEMTEHGQRTDLNRYFEDAQQLAKKQTRCSPAIRLMQLVDEKQFRQAMNLIKEYNQDGHLIRPKRVTVLQQLIAYNAHNNHHDWVNRLFQHLTRIFPKHHQAIVDSGLIAAQSYYSSKQSDKSRQLLEKLISRYQQTADTRQLNSYLIGLKKRQKKPTS